MLMNALTFDEFSNFKDIIFEISKKKLIEKVFLFIFDLKIIKMRYALILNDQ